VLDGPRLAGLVSGLGAPPDAEATTANTVPAAAPVAATLSARFRSRPAGMGRAWAKMQR